MSYLIDRQSVLDPGISEMQAKMIIDLPSAEPRWIQVGEPIPNDAIALIESMEDAKGYIHGDPVVALENMPSASEWIPVTPETMPEDYGTYICTCFDGCANRVTFVKWQNKLKQWILNGSRSYWKVIAWMPLPEPYEGGDAE